MKRNSLDNIMCIFTGGTIAMDSETLSSLHTADEILEYVQELKTIANIDFYQVSNIDSIEMQPDNWIEIASHIYKHYDDYNGFVVLHGTDTMIYTAAATSFLLQDLGKPIIFTGSQIPLYSKLATDARNNLINAVRFSLMDLAEVAIFFGTLLLRGNRARKISGFDINAFESFADDPIGKAGVRLSLSPGRRPRSDCSPKFGSKLETKVFLLKIFPSMPVETFDVLIKAGYKGIVVEAFGAGNVPIGEKSLLPGIKKAKEAGISVVICSQCEKGSAEDLYPSGKMLKKSGAILGQDMTAETALVKLMWVLGQTNDQNEIKKLMLSNLAMEISE